MFLRKRNLNREKGFSLVELMVVVTIIGILAGVAVPKFQTFKARASQAEGKSGLNGIYLAVASFETNYGELPHNGGKSAAPTAVNFQLDGSKKNLKLGFSMTGGSQKYDYLIAANRDTGWAATANMKRQHNATYDKLRINTNKWLCSPFDAASGVQANVNNKNDPTNANDCPQTDNGKKATLAPAIQTNDAPGFGG